jgi:hypothetical protein
MTYAREIKVSCPACGLPMSFSTPDDGSGPYWYCDGPNDLTTRKGCGELVETDA